MKTTISTNGTNIFFRKRMHRFFLRPITTTLAAFFITSFTNVSLAATANELRCGGLENAFGPLDYRIASADNKKLVERAHFTREVEYLVHRKIGEFGRDIDYTLRVFPNHPRALKSMMDLGFRTKTEKPPGANWPVWCYFDRAIRFTPDDGQVKTIYAIYLNRIGKRTEAIDQLHQAQKLLPESGNIHYNLGLIFLDLGEFENSLLHAHKAYALGFQLPGLRNRLKEANKWKEPLPKNETNEISQ